MNTAALPLFDYEAGQRARDAGIKLAAEHSPDYCQAAYDAIVRYARTHVHVHTDDIAAELGDLKPSHPNANGAPWARAIRDGIIQRSTETRPSKDPKKNAHLYPVYFSRVFDPRSSKP